MKKLIILFIVLTGCIDSRPVSSDKISGLHLNIVCIEGHEYYLSGHWFAPKLYDDGRPVKCEQGEEK